jgi:hypothetical protein
MRKFQGRTRTRIMCAGFVTAATVAAAVLAAAPPALAVSIPLTVAPAAGGLTGTLTVTGTGFLTGVTTPVAYFSTATCADPVGVVGGRPATVAAITKSTDNSATVTIGTGGAALALNSNQSQSYNLCVYASSADNAALVGDGDYVVTPNPTVTPSSGGVAGSLALSATGFLASISAPAAYFSTSSCPATHGVAPATTAAITKGTDDTATVTLGSGAAALSYNSGANRTYNLCVYASSASGAAIAAASTYSVAPTVTPLAGPQTGNITVTSNGSFAGLTSVGAYFSTSACGANYTTSSVTVGTATRTSDDVVTVAVPTTLALNTGAARSYYLCVYNGATSAATLMMGSTYMVAPAATTVTPNSGVSGAGGTVTVTFPSTSAIFTNATTYGGFASGGCPTAYTGIPTARQATVTKVSTTQATVTVPSGVGGANNQPFNLCFYSASTGDTLIGTSSLTAYTVTMGTSTLSANIGAGTGITVTLTSTNANAFTNSTTPAAAFFLQNGTTQFCPGSYTTTGGTAAQSARKISNSKASVQFPSSPLANGQYSICVYTSNDANTSKLAGLASYTVAPVPAISTVSPAQGSALGGNTITVTGQNLPTAAGSIQVTIGNTPVEPSRVTPIDANTFSFIAPPHSMGISSVVIKTDVGTDTLAGAYTYVNSLNVTPNTASSTGTASLDIFGTNFFDYTFSDTANTGAHVYLVSGTYDGTASSQNSGANRSNARVAADCLGVLVISDNELVCTMDLRQSLKATGLAFGDYSGYRTGVTVTTATTSTLMTSANPIFTLADIGKTVTATNIGPSNAGTNTIVGLLDGYTAILAAAPSAAVTSVTIGYRVSGGTVAAAGVNTGTTVTSTTNGTFSQADVGRSILEVTGNGDNIPVGTFITGVNETGTTLTLSNALTGTVANVDITSSSAVPAGAYNVQLVSNAAPGASSPTVSVVSSGSTFTVAPF